MLCSKAFQELFLVTLFIATDVSLFLLTDASSTTGAAFSQEAVITLVSAASLLVGVAASWLRDGRTGLGKAMRVSRWLRLLPIAALFCLSQLCLLQALERLGCLLVKVLLQLRLPATVLLSASMLGRRYNFYQVQGILNIFLGVVAFTMAHQNMDLGLVETASDATTRWVGLLLVVCQIGCSVLASVLAEKTLASTEEIPFYTAIAHLKAGEFAVALATLCVLPGHPFQLGELLQRPSLALAGFGPLTWMLALCLLIDGWMSALVVKSLSSVAKLIAKCLSLIVLYFAALACGAESFALPRLLLAILVVNGTILFAFSSQKRQPRGKPLREADRARLQETFKRFDEDGSNGLQPHEFDNMISHLGARLAKPQLQEAFQELDLNRDGQVDWDEFVAFWTSQPGLGGYSAPGLWFLRLRRGALDAR